MPLVKISTLEIDALVPESVDLNIVCPTSLFGSPLILSTITTSLLIKEAEDGFKSKLSRLIILGVTP